MGEFAAIDRIRRALPAPPPGETWIGDDAAVVEGGLLLAIDSVVAGVHFDGDAAIEDVGWKAMTVNVSDIAAMGGHPSHALVSVVGPPRTDLDRLYDGIAAAAEEYRCPVVGGDLCNGETLVVSVAVTGHVDGEPVLRSGAKAGDVIYVTGPLGGAAASGWRTRPRARVAEGQAAREAGATAMIDVSDGLDADLGHLAEASGVGVVVEHVPVAEGATEEQARRGGEDFELLFTASPDAPIDFAIRIGRCTDDPSQLPPPQGWEHDFS